EIFHEGIRIPPVKLYERGNLRRDVLDMICLNTRCPDIVSADILSMVGATRMGGRRMAEICAELGAEGYAAHCDAILDYAERIVRRGIEAIPDGVYHGEDSMAGEGRDAPPAQIAVTVTIKGSDVRVDFAGSSPQLRNYKNSSLANTYSAVYVAISTMLGADIPHNEGSYRMVSVDAPEGSVVNPRSPAPVTFSTVHPTYEIIHAIWRAFETVCPQRVSAGWGKLCHPVTSGRRTGSNELFVLYHMAAQPGAGAYAGRDGFDQVGQLQSLGAITIPNLEIYEQLYPIEFVKHEFRVDSGGAGRYRGGTGVEYAVRMLTATQNNLRGEGLGAPTGFGVHGGSAGAAGEIRAVDDAGADIEMPDCGVATLPPCVLTVTSSGGGGWGDPRTRPEADVARDVADGVVSVSAARDLYRVVIEPDTLAIDVEATRRHRGGAPG
ncbi:MAG: hydantoinase B/oxoprolinase family protein, partial [Vicinamibacterales bacterium]